MTIFLLERSLLLVEDHAHANSRGHATHLLVVSMTLLLVGCASAGPSVSAPRFAPGQWVSLFDAEDATLAKWKVVDLDESYGKARVEDGAIVIETGHPASGIRWTGPLLREDYEIELEGMRVEGRDFFCGLTFPGGDEPCTLILGGWGGGVVGLSNVDEYHAAENETTLGMDFEDERWYRVRLRVTRPRIQAWIDDDLVIDLEREGRHFSIWIDQEPCAPLGIGTWETKAALRNIRMRRVKSATQADAPAATTS